MQTHQQMQAEQNYPEEQECENHRLTTTALSDQGQRNFARRTEDRDENACLPPEAEDAHNPVRPADELQHLFRVGWSFRLQRARFCRWGCSCVGRELMVAAALVSRFAFAQRAAAESALRNFISRVHRQFRASMRSEPARPGGPAFSIGIEKVIPSWFGSCVVGARVLGESASPMSSPQ